MALADSGLNEALWQDIMGDGDDVCDDLCGDPVRETPIEVGTNDVMSQITRWRRLHTDGDTETRQVINFTATEEARYIASSRRTQSQLQNLPLGRVMDRIQCQLQGANAFRLALLSPFRRYSASTTFISGLKVTETTKCSISPSDDPGIAATLLSMADTEYILLGSLQSTREIRFLHQLGLVSSWQSIKGTSLLLFFHLSHFADSTSVVACFFDEQYVQLPNAVLQAQTHLNRSWRYISSLDHSRISSSIDTEWSDPKTRNALRLSTNITHTLPLDPTHGPTCLTDTSPTSKPSGKYSLHLQTPLPLTRSLLKTASMHLGRLCLETGIDQECAVSFSTIWQSRPVECSLVVQRNRSSSPPSWLPTPSTIQLSPPATPRNRNSYSFVSAALQRWIPKDVPTELEIIIPFDEVCKSFTIAIVVQGDTGERLLDSMHIEPITRHSIADRVRALSPLASGLCVRFGLTLIQSLPLAPGPQHHFIKSISSLAPPRRDLYSSPLRQYVFTNPDLYNNARLDGQVVSRIIRLMKELKLPLNITESTIMRWLKEARGPAVTINGAQVRGSEQRQQIQTVVSKLQDSGLAPHTEVIFSKPVEKSIPTASTSNPMTQVNARRRALLVRGKRPEGAVLGSSTSKKRKLD